MRTRGVRTWLAAVLLPVAAMAAMGQGFDPAHTAFGFELRTRWGQVLKGRFPRHEGEVTTLADGRRRVRISLATDAVEIVGSPRYTRYARGPEFFDAARHPEVRFVSDPYPPGLLRSGGLLRGVLTMHGIGRSEVFTIAPAPAGCERPGLDCDLVARGSVRRDQYGMDDWQLALRNRVDFALTVRLRDAAAP